jgi:hypothetical protein
MDKLLKEMLDKIDFLYERAKDSDRKMKEIVDKLEKDKKTMECREWIKKEGFEGLFTEEMITADGGSDEWNGEYNF